MNPRVKEVYANPDYTLKLIFTNGEIKIFDMNPYLNIGVFQELNDWNMFNTVKPFLGSIQWKNELDLCPDTLYMDSIEIENTEIKNTASLIMY